MTIRWGILGCGDVAHKRVAAAISSQAESQLFSACRRDESKLEAFCAVHGAKRAYTNAEDLIADTDVDALYIATPVSLHCEQTLAAARAGKHVLVEKPMAMSVAECDEMVAVGEERGVTLGVAYYRRFYPVVERMRALVAEGRIGEPFSITAVTATPFGFEPGEDGYWRVVLPEGGGGAMMDIGSHRINLFLSFFGNAIGVKALFSTLGVSYKAENCASVILQFESGAHGSLQCFFGTDVDPAEFTIVGTRGRLIASPLNGSELVIETAEGRWTESHPPPSNFNAPLIDDFVAAIHSGGTPRVSGDEGRRTNAVLERAYQSN